MYLSLFLASPLFCVSVCLFILEPLSHTITSNQSTLVVQVKPKPGLLTCASFSPIPGWSSNSAVGMRGQRGPRS